MNKETKLEFKVGAFVLLACVGLAVLIFSISDSSIFQEQKTFKVIFQFANGLKKSAPVRIAGVDEGIVSEVNLFFDRADAKTKAEVVFLVRKDTQIPVDSIVMIHQLGMLGEKYVEIIPGVDTKNFLTPNATVIGEDPIMNMMSAKRIQEVADHIEETIQGINTILLNEDNIASIHDTLANLTSLTTNMNEVMLAIKDQEGTMGRMIYDDGLYENIEGMTADLKNNPWKLLYKPKAKDNKEVLKE